MIIIDASVALKWIQEQEEYRESALYLYKNHREGKERILAPSLIYLEIANALITKSETNLLTTKKALKFIFDSNIEIYEPNEKDIYKTSTLSKKYQTSVYDMLYAVVAKENKTTLFTADENFIRKTGFKFVKHIKDL